MNYAIIQTDDHKGKSKHYIDTFLRIIGLLTLLGFIVVVSGAYFAASWLLVNDKPVEADAIVSLAGKYSRALHAADLYDRGYAKHIYLCRPVRDQASKHLQTIGIELPIEEDINVEILTQKGVLGKDITLYGHSLVSTLDEAETLYKTIKPTPKRLLIVTSPTHTRRAKIIFANVFKETEILAIATPYENFPQKWWQDRNSASNVLLEAAKTLYYRLGGAFRSTDSVAQ